MNQQSPFYEALTQIKGFSEAISLISSATNGSIDVGRIFAQLISAENKSKDRIDAKIASQKEVISELGVIKSRVAALEDAHTAFKDITSYEICLQISTTRPSGTLTDFSSPVNGRQVLSSSSAAG
jgi:hypothetical protein